MSIGDFFSEYWWAIFILLPLFIIYLKLSQQKTIGEVSLADLSLVFEFGCYVLMIFLIQNYIFNGHWFFTISIPFFIILWVMAIHFLLSKDDIYVLESTMQSEAFWNITDMEKKYCESTSQRLLVMDRQVYDAKRHIGEAKYNYWQGSDRIKFTDFYEDEKGIFYHPEFSQLHNISFYTAKSFWLKMKDDLPEVMRQNTMLTWLSNYYLAHKQAILKKKFEYHLSALDKQHEHAPFEMPDTMKELYDKLSREKRAIEREHEEMEKREPVEKSEVTNDD